MTRILVLGGIPESLTNFRGPLLRDMISLGHQVYASAPSASDKIKDELSCMGVTYCNIPLSRTGTSPLKDIRTIFSMIKLMGRIKPEVVLSYTIKPVLYGSIAAWASGVPVICSLITGLGFAFSNSGLKARVFGLLAKQLYAIALRVNKVVFFQNPDDLNVFRKHNIVRSSTHAVVVNGSGVDLDFFQPSGNSTSTSFLLIARLIKEKGIYDYIEAAKIVKYRYPNITFFLVGYIDKENPSAISGKELQSWIESKTVTYLGYLADVRPAIHNCSVYVLPSFYPEGTPKSVLEAMAMGKPIITTDTPGCRETVRPNQNGFLVPPHDVPQLVTAILYFIENPAETHRMGDNSRKIAVEKYDVHKVNATMLEAMTLKH